MQRRRHLLSLEVIHVIHILTVIVASIRVQFKVKMTVLFISIKFSHHCRFRYKASQDPQGESALGRIRDLRCELVSPEFGTSIALDSKRYTIFLDALPQQRSEDRCAIFSSVVVG